MKLSQKQIDQRSGHSDIFWRNVDKQSDNQWIWTGNTNTNHDPRTGVQYYYYGEFELVTRETAYNAKPTKQITTKLAHRIALYLKYGREVPANYDVFPLNNNHLDINPANLALRERRSRVEITSERFFNENN